MKGRRTIRAAALGGIGVLVLLILSGCGRLPGFSPRPEEERDSVTLQITFDPAAPEEVMLTCGPETALERAEVTLTGGAPPAVTVTVHLHPPGP